MPYPLYETGIGAALDRPNTAANLPSAW